MVIAKEWKDKLPLIRGHHSFDDHFTQIPNHWLRDSRLTLKAIGLLAQIMSHTPGWKMSIRSLAKFNNCGQETIKTAILELEKLGYLTRSEEQGHNPDGTFADYSFTTQDPFQNPVTVKPRHGEIEHKEEQVIKNNINTKEEAITAKRPRGAAYPLPEDWQPSERLMAKFETDWKNVNKEIEIKKFLDYWHLDPTAKKKNWDQAFSNWMHSTEEKAQTRKTGFVHTMSREEAEIQDLLKRAKR